MLSRVSSLSLAIAAVLAAFPLAATAQTASSSERISLADLAQRLQVLEQRLSADNDPSPESARAEVAELQQRLAILERKLELQQEDATAKAASASTVAVNDKGLSVRSSDGNFEIKLRGLIQADQRLFFDDDGVPQNDTFAFRRIRPTLEGSLGSLVGFRLTPEFAGDSATIVDAYVDVKFDPRYTLRVGKVKAPIGLERLQSASAISFIERGFPTELAPNRDIGAQLQGELAKGRVNYTIGVYNGAADGRDAPTSDADDNFEFAGRVFFEPWKNDASALSGLGFGIAASSGDKNGLGNNFLPRYRTPGQAVFFNYRTTIAADGEHRRISPQFHYYRNAFGLLGEYIRSEQDVWISGNAATHTSLTNTAWQLTGSWVITGEDAGYRGVVKPTRSFLAGGEGWGAFELVGRYGELDVDDDAFPLYASADSSASRSRAWGIGLNWYLSSNLKLVFNHTHATFDGGAPLGADREDEKTFFSRVQVAF